MAKAKKIGVRYAKEEVFDLLGVSQDRWKAATERLRKYRKGRTDIKSRRYEYAPKLAAGVDYVAISDRVTLYTEKGVGKIKEMLADMAAHRK